MNVLHLSCSTVNYFCFLSNVILGALSSKLHLVSSSSEVPQEQEQLEKWKLDEMEIMESKKMKGEQKNSVLNILEWYTHKTNQRALKASSFIYTYVMGILHVRGLCKLKFSQVQK